MPRYSETLMDHFESPRNRGVLEPPCAVAEASLPGGAPRVRLYCRVEGGLVRRATYEAAGCGVTIACCSVLTELILDRSVADCLTITAQQVEAALDGLPFEKRFCSGLAIEALHRTLGGMVAHEAAPKQ
jgi:NifU-like protein involved in Fe-S cluster formation